jgi:hypothetical protein
MIPDLDIYSAAKLLVDQHGEDAGLRAAERADALLEEGDVEGSAVWRAIGTAIGELQRERLPDEAVNWSTRRKVSPRCNSWESIAEQPNAPTIREDYQLFIR